LGVNGGGSFSQVCASVAVGSSEKLPASAFGLQQGLDSPPQTPRSQCKPIPGKQAAVPRCGFPRHAKKSRLRRIQSAMMYH